MGTARAFTPRTGLLDLGNKFCWGPFPVKLAFVNVRLCTRHPGESRDESDLFLLSVRPPSRWGNSFCNRLIIKDVPQLPSETKAPKMQEFFCLLFYLQQLERCLAYRRNSKIYVLDGWLASVPQDQDDEPPRRCRDRKGAPEFRTFCPLSLLGVGAELQRMRFPTLPGPLCCRKRQGRPQSLRPLHVSLETSA